jgi:hypothetical protein
MILRALPWWIAIGIMTIGYTVVWAVVPMHRNLAAELPFAIGYMAAAGWLGLQAWREARMRP